MHFSNNLIVASLFVIASSFVNAATNTTSSSSHPLTTLNSQNDFCFFLPPKPGLVVAVNEDNGIPFCVNKGTVPNATSFPSGFITTAHYLKTSSYVQVTGFFDRSKYKLGANDGGGQYDNHVHGKPVGAQCKGYNYFVNLVEPDVERFCIRCCQDKADCNTGRSGYGCLRVVSGDYTRDNNFINGSSTIKNATKSSSTKKATTTHNHSNSNMNSVYAELDALPSTEDDSTSSDDSTITADSKTATDDSNTNANQEIATEIESLKNDLANQMAADQVQTQWNTFATKLATDYPQVSDQINQLSTITTSLITADQWNAFFNLVSDKIIQLQQQDNSTADATEPTDDTTDATTEEGATTTDDATTTDSHTNRPEDLEWLFAHRNSHDNQATW